MSGTKIDSLINIVPSLGDLIFLLLPGNELLCVLKGVVHNIIK